MNHALLHGRYLPLVLLHHAAANASALAPGAAMRRQGGRRGWVLRILFLPTGYP